MGFCYQVSGGTRALCCDNCGHAGGVRKVSCKYGYCQATALCAACRKAPVAAAIRAECDAKCKPAAEKFDAAQAAEAAAIEAGELIFCAAIGKGELVEMVFRGKGDARESLTVAQATYDMAYAAKYGAAGVATLAQVAAIEAAA